MVIKDNNKSSATEVSHSSNLHKTIVNNKFPSTTTQEERNVSIVEDTAITLDQDHDTTVDEEYRYTEEGQQQQLKMKQLEFSKAKKITIFIIVLLGLSMSQFSMSGLYPAFPSIQKEFQTTETVTNGVIAATIVVGGIVPSMWATYSEYYGRRSIYALIAVIGILGNLASVFSPGIVTLIVIRAITSVGTSGCTSVGAGVIVEVFNDNERGKALSWFTAMPIILTIFAPIICGLLTQKLGWRSIFMFFSICYLLLLVAIAFLLPETHPRKRLGKETKKNHGHRSCVILVNPFSSFKLFKYLNLFLTSSYVAICMGTNYAANATFTWSYSKQYNFDSTIVGLCFIAGGFGYCMGAIVAGILSDRLYKSRAAKAKEAGQEIYPEMRLSTFVLGIGVIVMAGGYISYGWCIDKNVHFAFGMISNMFAQFGLMLWVCFLTVYATQCFPGRGASVQDMPYLTASNIVILYSLFSTSKTYHDYNWPLNSG
ncbi:major facilitator superfamily domain-containing protein [Phascolomyces articulosus]|uniref:Major facilitator superfamily domain-containing protein n=1 Tax=Phascolomyces articulosus TaxID=60185 RepID=A0AAD5K5H4_9FUNG|nr:major facilitator superfamily domain-containing protein [Phascolomyces articulosus]